MNLDIESARNARLSAWTQAAWAVVLSLALVLVAGLGAYAYDTEWIAPGKAVSADKLKAALDEVQARLAQLETAEPLPPGSIVAYGGATIPEGWILCDGAAVGRTGEYADLFAAIQIAFGNGDGVSTFNVPDLRGYFLRGLDPDGHIDSGRVLGSVQSDELKSHAHVVQAYSNATSGGPLHFTLANWSGGTLVDTRHPVTSTGGSETRPKNVAINYIIKY